MAIGIGRLIKRYCLVILFPSVVVSSIYADYTHTQEWKRSKLEKKDKELLES